METILDTCLFSNVKEHLRNEGFKYYTDSYYDCTDKALIFQRVGKYLNYKIDKKYKTAYVTKITIPDDDRPPLDKTAWRVLYWENNETGEKI